MGKLPGCLSGLESCSLGILFSVAEGKDKHLLQPTQHLKG